MTKDKKQLDGKPKRRGRKSLKTNEKVIARAARVAEAMQYRIMGYTFEQIGDQLGVTRQAAHQMVLEGLAATLQEPSDELRTLEVSRLDQMLVKVYEDAVKGDIRAIDSVLKIQERRAKLLGIDAPVKTALTDPDGRPCPTVIRIVAADNERSGD
jgi:hypothetical protein